MSVPESLISNRAKTLISAKRRLKRGRRDDSVVSLNSGVEDRNTINQTLNQSKIQIFNDLQAFQCSGILAPSPQPPAPSSQPPAPSPQPPAPSPQPPAPSPQPLAPTHHYIRGGYAPYLALLVEGLPPLLLGFL